MLLRKLVKWQNHCYYVKTEPVNILTVQVYIPTSEYKEDEVKIYKTQSKKFLQRKEEVKKKLSSWETGTK
jgi:hypothetical protein